jgi:hypothetical protein
MRKLAENPKLKRGSTPVVFTFPSTNVDKWTLEVMSSSSSDGNDPVLVGLGDVRDYNVDNILPLLPPTLLRSGTAFSPPHMIWSEVNTLGIASHILQGQENGSPPQQPINNGTKATKMANSRIRQVCPSCLNHRSITKA